MIQAQNKQAFLPVFGRVIRNTVKQGCLTVIDSRGGSTQFGNPGEEPSATIRFHDRWLPLRIALNPSLAAGEAYMHGRLTIEQGDLRSFLAVATTNMHLLDKTAYLRTLGRLAIRTAAAFGGNRRKRARRNVERHYDLPPEFYALFLDRDLHYSCAYFPTGKETIEQAQTAKVRHIMAKLCLGRGQRVLDIGSGWGSLALAMAAEAQVIVKGITLSGQQLEKARERARQAGDLAGRAEFALEDYRDVAGTFDRIVSVGMLEHVGRAHLDTYFARVADLLDNSGVALIHSIGRWDGSTGPDPWTERYIFPGSHVPALSEVIPAIERSGLLVTDIEILRLHYAETLRHWFARFTEHRASAAAMYGEEFCRMWEFYIAGAEIGFRNRPLMVFQIQLAHRRDAVPLTRDYIAMAEHRPTASTVKHVRAVN